MAPPAALTYEQRLACSGVRYVLVPSSSKPGIRTPALCRSGVLYVVAVLIITLDQKDRTVGLSSFTDSTDFDAELPGVRAEIGRGHDAARKGCALVVDINAGRFHELPRLRVSSEEHLGGLVPTEQQGIVDAPAGLIARCQLFVHRDIGGINVRDLHARQQQCDAHGATESQGKHASADFILSKVHRCLPSQVARPSRN